MRRDAELRRAALIEAAEACFFRSGYLVPLEEIADRAGVGRGTLYRNFKDRMELAVAVFEREVGRLEDQFDATLPLEEAIVELVIGAARTSALFARIAADMPIRGSYQPRFQQLRDRLVRLLRPSVERAHRDNHLASDIGADEIFVVTRMLGGLLHPQQTAAEATAVVGEALSLVLRGLRPR